MNNTKETPCNNHILNNPYLFIDKIKDMSKKLTTEEFIDKSKLIHGSKYDYSLVEYVNNHTKVKIQCTTHGVFEQLPNNHTSKKCGCLKCAGHGKTTNSFIEQCKIVHGEKYNYSKTIFKSVDHKVIIICKQHGEFKQKAYDHMKGSGCSKCRSKLISDKFRKTLNQFIQEANAIHLNKYDYSKVIYITGRHKVIITCLIHGDFMQIPDSHLQGRGCPKCNESHGEREIRRILEKNNILYEFQKKFSDCISNTNRKLPFDFYLPDINICIEYNGRQHYSMNGGYFGANIQNATIAFERLKNNDREKIKYCKHNGISLLIIKYNDNIEQILNQLIATIK